MKSGHLRNEKIKTRRTAKLHASAAKRGHVDLVPSAAAVQKDSVNNSGLKDIARKLLPPKSMLRKLILLEPDNVSREEAIAKIGIFLRMLYEEVK